MVMFHNVVVLHHTSSQTDCMALSFRGSLPPAGSVTGVVRSLVLCVDVSSLCLLFACPKVMDEPAGGQTYSICSFSQLKRRDCDQETTAAVE